MNKKKSNTFLKLLLIIFIIYLGLFIASVSGYYEAHLSEKVLLTDNAIKRFEKDILEGKEVDINTYVKNEKQDYSNAFTKAGDTFSEKVELFLTDGIGEMIKVFKNLFF